ncbi:MAG: EthD family reductase [Cognaticolwellia sp.]
MTTVKLMVLYPIPIDVEQFEKDYREHLILFHHRMNIPFDFHPYTVTKIHSNPDSQAPYYQIFTMPFPTVDELQHAMNTPEMQEVARDAARISSGGAPVILVGNDAD